MTQRRWAVTGTYYVVLAVLMALIIPKLLVDVLPKVTAHHVSSDSEGYTLALLLPLWIQAVRPRLTGSRLEAPVTALTALASFGIGLYLYNSDVLGTVKTLNETFFALAVLIPFVQLRRPLPALVGPVLAAALLALTVGLELTGAKHLTTALAEAVAMLLVAPLVFDTLDRGILDGARPSSLRSRQCLWVGLLGIAGLSIALRHVAPQTDFHDVVDYGARAQEAWVGMLLISLYFSVSHWAGRPWTAERVTVPQPRDDAAQRESTAPLL